jgi:hypothetical protein
MGNHILDGLRRIRGLDVLTEGRPACMVVTLSRTVLTLGSLFAHAEDCMRTLDSAEEPRCIYT